MIEYVDEGVSSATIDRPVFQKLIADVKSGKIQKVVTFEMTRMSRDVVDTPVIMRMFKKHNVVVEVPFEGTIPFDTALAQIITAFEGFVGAQEREKPSKAGIERARPEGKPIGAPKGNSNRRGRKKVYDKAFIDRLMRLSEKLTCREVAVEMGISNGTVNRLRRQFEAGRLETIRT